MYSVEIIHLYKPYNNCIFQGITIMPSDIDTKHFFYRVLPHTYHPYISLARFDRSIGYMLLYYPCIWGLMLSWNVAGIYYPDPIILWDKVLLYMVVFFIGAVIMRGAGCAWNDIQDRHFDAQVARTKNRPLPSGQITVRQAYICVGVLLAIGTGILVLLPLPAIIAAGMACVPAVLYPFLKRITYFPQLWLGVTFNWGIWVGWFTLLPAHIGLQITYIWIPFVTHILGIIWTLAYDTIYAHQDRTDDVYAGVKSSALVFAGATYTMLWISYTIIIAILVGLVWQLQGGTIANLGIIGMGITLAIWIKNLCIDTPESCKNFFRLNRFVGIFISIILLACVFT